ncbi:MAG: nucleoside hydrolase-like domain-containing protein, partial [Planctomycetota bacterium]
MMKRKRILFITLLLLISLVTTQNTAFAKAMKADKRPRIIATTDGEIDDRCSMVRFLLYANEWDIEGI